MAHLAGQIGAVHGVHLDVVLGQHRAGVAGLAGGRLQASVAVIRRRQVHLGRAGVALLAVGRLPVQLVEPEDLTSISEDRDRPRNVLFTVVLGREHRLERTAGGGFDGAEYTDHPELYRSALPSLLPHVTVLINGTYWEPGLPVLVTKESLRELWTREREPKLRVIGDVTCDIRGSVEVTEKATTPGDPVFVWNPDTGAITSGVTGRGPVVMAVDNLPCELPVEASEHFGDSLLRFVPPLARCDWEVPLEALALPREIRDAIIVHRGELAPAFAGLERLLRAL